ncbi:MAG: transketolase [Gemmatimonadota bacterium]|jgi:transketolase|nr:transketolase [Gemmatimonadota bacterium]MDP6803038.1 transketolase [Gemmatimonadota bacterium]MDP7031997.1 transketolase [Gemmatimonadota bacterium]
MESTDPKTRFTELEGHFPHWEKTKDMVDSLIDLMLNYRQSGHPGGSRSKVHAMVATLLGGFMRWDIRNPEKPYGDRVVLVAGHTVPLVYAVLTVLNHALRLKYDQTGDEKYLVTDADRRMLRWEDLLDFRCNGGLAGHAEMEGKTLFLKYNTGPSGHGSPAAAGQAMALKRAGAGGVRVFAFEGEGGLTAGAIHETKNSAWGLGLDNLVYVVDWNDYGIDPRSASSVVYGTPQDWFGSSGWRVSAAEDGSAWADVTRALQGAIEAENPDSVPSCAYMKTIKGRGYMVTGASSHGAPHKMNSETFWTIRKEFTEKYGIDFEGTDQRAPEDPKAQREQYAANLQRVLSLFEKDPELLDYIADRLVEIGGMVPDSVPGVQVNPERTPFEDARFWDYRNYPEEMWAKPGEKKPNRAALATWGAFVNTLGRKDYGRPLFLAMSADLADSTNISGFAKGFGGEEGWGWYERSENPEGALLPQEITEFANAGICTGLACTNLSISPLEKFNGFYSACSTYGSFSYLKYGPMRLFSQISQDSDIRVGKVLWVAGHSGPETAEDSRTHFGVFAPGVTDLFPEGRVVNLHPWEYNEVPVMLGAAFAMDYPIVALHLTRPPVEIPDREALGMASHLEAARGAYLIRDWEEGKPKGGTVLVQGTMSTANLLKVLPEIDRAGLNARIVAAVSPQLFARQPEEYRNSILPPEAQLDITFVTNRSRRLMYDWVKNPVAHEYAMSSDRDDRWRTGGSVDEVMAEAHLSPEDIFAGIEGFVRDRKERLARTRRMLDSLAD